MAAAAEGRDLQLNTMNSLDCLSLACDADSSASSIRSARQSSSYFWSPLVTKASEYGGQWPLLVLSATDALDACVDK